jgi:hypothetical protein
MLLEIAQRTGSRSQMIQGLSNGGYAALRTGEWDWALERITPMLAEELDPTDRATLLAASTGILALRGRPTDDLVAALDAALGGTTDPQSIGERDATLGWVHLASGDLHGAAAAWRRATATTGYATFFAPAGRALLWGRDPVGARASLADLDASGSHGPGLETDRAVLRAGIAALEGRSAEAIAEYRTALRAWRDLGLLLDEALTVIDMATLLDPTDPEVADAVAAGRRILGTLDARPLLARLDAAVAA